MNIVEHNQSARPSTRRRPTTALDALAPLDSDNVAYTILIEANALLGLICDALEGRITADPDDKQLEEMHALLLTLQARLAFARESKSESAEALHDTDDETPSSRERLRPEPVSRARNA